MTLACQKPRHNAQWWDRYWRLKRLAFIRRKIWVRSFYEFGDLYGGQWELVEEVLIRNECEEHGIPMGYGRVGKAPRQLTWGMTVPKRQYEDSDAGGAALESGDDAPV